MIFFGEIIPVEVTVFVTCSESESFSKQKTNLYLKCDTVTSSIFIILTPNKECYVQHTLQDL